MACDAELSYFRCVLHVGTDAKTHVVVADVNKTEFVRTFRQSCPAHIVWNLIFCDKLIPHVDMGIDDLIDATSDLIHLILSQIVVDHIVAFAFLTLDMVLHRTWTTIDIHHCTVKNMFSRMHRRIFLFVVLKNWFFHIIIFCKDRNWRRKKQFMGGGRVQQTIVFYLIRKNRQAFIHLPIFISRYD